MTHDALLVKLMVLNADESEQTRLSKTTQALRAVVELHKPTPEAVFVSEIECKPCDSAYPCETIQTIERELS